MLRCVMTRSCYPKRLILTATAVALSSHGFVMRPVLRQLPTSTRLLSSRNNEDENGGLLSSLKKGAKSLVPGIFKEDEKKALDRQRKKKISGGMKELLKDAPLPVRMMGRIVAPMFSSALSGLADAMEEQKEAVQTVINDAKGFLLADPAVGNLLGTGPMQVGAPFSQSSSSVNINGRQSTQVIISFPVQGSSASGVVQASSSNGKIDQLLLQVGGRTVPVSLSGDTSSFGAFSGGGYDDDNIIEAEIVEKDDSRGPRP